MTLPLAALALWLAQAAPVVWVQPGAPKPGDPVLIAVGGLDAAPEGQLGREALTFVPCPAGFCALVGLSVDARPGPLALEVTPAGHPVIEGQLDVVPASYRSKKLTVGRRFTNPSKAQRARSAADTRAFAAAFDRDFEPLVLLSGLGWPRPPVITAPFGDKRTLNGKKKSQHFGLDLDGEVGAPIVSAGAGEVVLARDCFASGNTVLVHHGARLFTAYFHLSAIEVEVGQRVTLGQPLGKVGMTGRVTGPHLHFGAKLDGRWVDPEVLLTLDFSRAAVSGRATPAGASRETH